ncbi:unnamed protein product [Phytomonas sp. Hart1]|nr:unnamed protein product [Phytomonas sp. Hart1]|eukprot:CCW70433.1 unnamed protein product [Phytomonas sp. isolate Hart1]
MGGSITRPPELSPTPPLHTPVRRSLRIESSSHDKSNVNSPNIPQTQRGETNAAAISNDELLRREKLGILLVQLGVASEEKIFGRFNSEAMRDFQQGRISDLIYIPPSQERGGDLGRWFRPWRWFSLPAVPRGKAAVARWVSNAAQNEMESEWNNNKKQKTTSTPKEEMSELDSPRAVSSVEEERWGEALSSEGRRKRSALPPVHFKILQEDEVDSLTPSAKSDREVLLNEEAQLHKLLQGIEDMRRRYFVSSDEMRCKSQVLAVVKCYEEANASARKKREAMQKQIARNRTNGFRKINDADEEETASIVVFDVLACGNVVEELRTCTALMVKTYSAREL